MSENLIGLKLHIKLKVIENTIIFLTALNCNLKVTPLYTFPPFWYLLLPFQHLPFSRYPRNQEPGPASFNPEVPQTAMENLTNATTPPMFPIT